MEKCYVRSSLRSSHPSTPCYARTLRMVNLLSAEDITNVDMEICCVLEFVIVEVREKCMVNTTHTEEQVSAGGRTGVCGAHNTTDERTNNNNNRHNEYIEVYTHTCIYRERERE